MAISRFNHDLQVSSYSLFVNEQSVWFSTACMNM